MKKQIHTINDKKESEYRLEDRIRKYVNKILVEKFGKTYFPSIPLNDIFGVLKESRIIVLQEDGTPWSGMLLGDKGSERFDLAYQDVVTGEYLPISNSILALQWYKMPSGKYEINVYLS